MSRLVKAFLDIALWRESPAILPASAFLLALVAAASALLEVAGDWLPPGPRPQLLMRVILTVTVPVCFTWLVLALTNRRPRFLQTGSAVMGVDLLASFLFFPLDAAIRSVATDQPLPVMLALLSYAVLIAYLIASMNVWRSALDTGLISAGLVSLGYVVLQLVLGRELLSTTP
jgi:hypothetical protein